MNHTTHTTNHTIAVDAAKSARPGVPAQRPPTVVGRAHWMAPEIQRDSEGVTKDAQRQFRGTFGTGQKPSGLSGVVRRYAYTVPDYRVKRWALLLFADRLEWLESGATPALLGVAAAGTIGAFAFRALRRR